MNKTPVSILQEIMVKKGTVPNYELIHDGGGTHINTFTYQVTCDGFIAIGTGRCKKDAKHEAASAMLTKIAEYRNYPQLPASPADSPVRTPLPDKIPVSPRTRAKVPFVNTVGALHDLCVDNNLQEPEYIPISDVGPPHARVFTIRCTVSNFIEDGIGTTKKQAKHEAAKKMIDRISDLMTDLNGLSMENKSTCVEESQSIDLARETAKAQYPALSKVSTARKINLGIKLADYHTVIKNSIDENLRHNILEELQNIIPKNFDEPITDALITETLSKLENLLSEINITITMNNINLDIIDKEIHFIKVAQLDTCVPFTQIGIGKTELEASFKALCYMIDSLKLVLS